MERQAKILRSGGVIRQETRRYDESKRVPFLCVSKEGAADYRYFPEPDLPCLKSQMSGLRKCVRSYQSFQRPSGSLRGRAWVV